MDKILLSDVVHLTRSFWDDTGTDTEKEKDQFVLRQLTLMTVRFQISTRSFTLWNEKTRYRETYRSSGEVTSVGEP